MHEKRRRIGANIVYEIETETLLFFVDGVNCKINEYFRCYVKFDCFKTLQWRHNGCDGVSNHQTYDSLLNRLYRRRSQKTSKLRVTGIYAGISSVTGEFPAQMASNTENVSIWLRHLENMASQQRVIYQVIHTFTIYV